MIRKRLDKGLNEKYRKFCLFREGISMFNAKFVFLIVLSLLLTSNVYSLELKKDQLSFDFMSSDGSFWYDCNHEKGTEPHQWKLVCGSNTNKYEFNLHLVVTEHKNSVKDDVTIEFHYWADRRNNKNKFKIEPIKCEDNYVKSSTQSTWITVDKNANTKKILGYLGFDNDATQLRVEILF